MVYFIFFLVSLLASTVGAISGIGGGVIIKPALDAISELSSKSISFLSGCTVLSMALVSIFLRRRQGGAFEYRRGTMLGIGAAAGGVCGKLMMNAISRNLNDRVLGRTQAAALCLMILLILIYYCTEKNLKRKNLQSSFACLGLGLAMGIVSSFLGIGGGPLNLAILRYFFSMDSRGAAIHSLYVIAFSQTASLVLSLLSETIPVSLLPLLAITVCGGVLGGIWGRTASKKLSERFISGLYILVLILVSCISAGNYFSC